MICILIVCTPSLIKVLYLLVHSFKDCISDKATLTRRLFTKIKNTAKGLTYSCDTLKVILKCFHLSFY